MTVRLTGGAARTFDMLRVRGRNLVGRPRESAADARTQYAGYVAWRATIPESELTPASFEAFRDSITYSLLPSGHVLVYPIPNLDGALEPGGGSRTSSGITTTRKATRSTT